MAELGDDELVTLVSKEIERRNFIAVVSTTSGTASAGVLVIPDVLANAGGVTVSYFEWVQDISAYFRSEEEINARLDKIMGDAFAAVWDAARARGLLLRTAAFVLACERVLMARKLRGLYP